MCDLVAPTIRYRIVNESESVLSVEWKRVFETIKLLNHKLCNT